MSIDNVDEIFEAICKKVKIDREAREKMFGDIGSLLLFNPGSDEVARAAVQIGKHFVCTPEEIAQGCFNNQKISYPQETDAAILNRIPDYLLLNFYVERCCEIEKCKLPFQMKPLQRKYCPRCAVKEAKKK